MFPIVNRIVAAVVLAGAFAMPAYAQQAQLSASASQTGSGPAKVRLDVVDFAVGIDHPTPTDIVIKHSGLYFMMISAQIGSKAATGYVDIFIRVNGKNVPNTNKRQSIVSSDHTAVLVSQGVGLLKPGDVITVLFSASDPSLGLIATKPRGEPAVPAVTVSIFRFGG